MKNDLNRDKCPAPESSAAAKARKKLAGRLQEQSRMITPKALGETKKMISMRLSRLSKDNDLKSRKLRIFNTQATGPTP